MLFSSRSLENYLEVDHRNSPGFTIEEAHRAGMGCIAEQVAKGRIAKIPVATCGHCQRQVIMNPMRTRERSRCFKCWNYLCDNCKTVQVANGGECKPFVQVIEELWNEQVKKLQAGDIHVP